MTEPTEVEVVCPSCPGVGYSGRTTGGYTCTTCQDSGRAMARLVPDSRTALVLALGEAAEKWDATFQPGARRGAQKAADVDLTRALDALRKFDAEHGKEGDGE